MHLRFQNNQVSLHGITLPLMTALTAAMRVWALHGQQTITIVKMLKEEREKDNLTYETQIIVLQTRAIQDVWSLLDALDYQLGYQYQISIDGDRVTIEYDEQQ